MKATFITLQLALFLLASAVVFSADIQSQVGRAISAKNSKAIVTIELVLEENASYGGQSEKRETKMSATGTVIDPSGLVVTALSQIDPMSLMPDTSGEDFKLTINVTDALIRQDDGTEIPVDVVVRDRDLNLAFLKPKTPVTTKLPYVNLAIASNPLQLDRVLTIYRLGQVAGRSIACGFDDVMGVVVKPRKFFVISNPYAQGGPAFTMDGKCVGIVVRKSSVKSAARTGGMQETLMVVMPSDTVMRAAEQAKKPKNNK